MTNLQKFYFCKNNQNIITLTNQSNSVILRPKSSKNFNGLNKIILFGNKNCKSCGGK